MRRRGKIVDREAVDNRRGVEVGRKAAWSLVGGSKMANECEMRNYTEESKIRRSSRET